MKKMFRLMAVALLSLIVAGMLAACGDNTATTAPAATTAAASATTAAATTAAATTAAASATTAAATTAAGATTAAAAGAGGSGTIRIYSSLPMTGSSKEQADTLVNAMKLALEDFTQGTNKIGNYTIDYQPLDDATAAKGQWDADQEKSNANKALNDPDAMVYLGTFNSGAAKVSIPILNQANLGMISPANTLPCLTRFSAAAGCDKSEPDTYYPNKTRNYFRVITADDVQGPAVVDFINNTLKAKKVFVIDDSQAYGKGLADAVANSCKDSNIDCSQRASINGKESDYKSLAAQIKSANPDAIFFGGITQQQAGKLVADIRAAGIKAPFMGGDGINETAFIKDGGAAAEGVYSTLGGLPEDKLPAKGQDFVKRYKAKYGELQGYTVYGYEAMSVALNAIKTAGTKDRKAVLQALANTKDFDGILGKWSFDKNGDTSLTDYTVYQVTDGKWQVVTTVKPKVNIGG
ncbi:MAG TPA: branched-chain amino acid ABC transporter substrate-binding protein [Chloroflexia bacterium]|nr:branched-chain amino acid ABC transporter substrate-binding protein [Chloroflexia bacterium]